MIVRHAANTPESLLSVTTDYPPQSASTPRFWYERAGAAYNLAFEQPPRALDMREFVVYNPAGPAVLTSHDSDLLLFQGDELKRRRGFPSSADVRVIRAGGCSVLTEGPSVVLTR
jgi:hypothetical protein